MSQRQNNQQIRQGSGCESLTGTRATLETILVTSVSNYVVKGNGPSKKCEKREFIGTSKFCNLKGRWSLNGVFVQQPIQDSLEA